MASITVKDYKIHNLQKEYNRYSNFLFNLQNHINLLHNYSIININDYNQHIKTISDLLRKMNNKYNSCMVDACEETGEESDEGCDIDILVPVLKSSDIQDTNFDDINNLITIHKMIDDNSHPNDPFDDIKTELVEIYSKVGFSSLYECLNVLIGECYDTMYTPETLSYLNVYNRIFIPIKFTIQEKNEKNENDENDGDNNEMKNNNNGNNEANENNDKANENNEDNENNDKANENNDKANENNIFFFHSIDPINEVLLDNCAELCIKKPHSDEYIHLTGFFAYDGLNIVMKTSQICNNFIYQKKKEIENFISNRTDINEKFRKF